MCVLCFETGEKEGLMGQELMKAGVHTFPYTALLKLSCKILQNNGNETSLILYFTKELILG